MPVLHDYQCESCGKIEEAVQPYEMRDRLCADWECSGTAHRILSFSKNSRTVDVFNEYREENLGDDNPVVTSKQHLARLCEDRGLVSRGLNDGYRNYGRKKEL